MKILVVASGEIENLNLLKEEVKLAEYVVCADGGLDYLRKINKLPDIVLGDLDSITKSGKEYIDKNHIELLKFPVMKNMTDNELAIDFIIKEKNPSSITFLGVTGSRLDHSLINIFTLKSLYKKNIDSKIRDGNNYIYYTEGYLKLKKRAGYFVSIIPLSDEGIVVSLEGFLYPLNKFHMEFASSRGISNEIVGECGHIKIYDGNCLVIESKDK